METLEGTTQSPKPGWQPSVVRQCVLLEPHQPYSEQQAPKTEPAHVWPRGAPHWPSDETGAVLLGVLGGGDAVGGAQDEGRSMMVLVVVVDEPVTVCVTVWIGPIWVVVTMLEVVLEDVD